MSDKGQLKLQKVENIHLILLEYTEIRSPCANFFALTYLFGNCQFTLSLVLLKSLQSIITTQRYTQIVTIRYARCVYLVFVFTMLIHLKWNNIVENSYFSRNRQNGREISNPCSQKCPNPSREIQVQTL